jgi:anion-transporting  ArsA/GET3 family ATPase
LAVNPQSTGLAWLDDARLVVFVGDGGVGKTTCAAAAAVAAARAGKRVCALTIDPAPRLAETLGLATLADTPSRIDLASIGVQSGGALDALRLDTEATFDRLVRSLAPSSSQAETVLANPIYRAIAGRLGGSDAYMAFQRVYELDAQGDYDLIVIDTPPAAHVGDLLAAPARLASLIDTGATKILADPAVAALRAGSKLAAAAIRTIVATVSRLAGMELTTRVSQFADAFEGILAQLSERADRVGTLLRDDDCRFVHVTTAERRRVGQTRDLCNSLAAHGIDVAARIVNRILPPADEPDGDLSITAAVASGDKAADSAGGPPAGTKEAVGEIHRLLEQLRKRQRLALEALRSLGEGSVATLVVHEDTALGGHDDVVRNVDVLVTLADLLGNAQASRC